MRGKATAFTIKLALISRECDARTGVHTSLIGCGLSEERAKEAGVATVPSVAEEYASVATRAAE